MKSYKLSMMVGALILVGSLTTKLISQACSPFPTVTLSLQNPARISATEFQFDVVVTNTGTVPIKFSGLQFGVSMPSNPGGTITASVTPPTSPAPLNVEAFPGSGPTGSLTYTAATFQIRTAGTPYLVEGSSVTMSQGVPMLWKRIKVVSSTPWSAASTTLTLNTYNQSAAYTKNLVINYCNGNPNSNSMNDNPSTSQTSPASPGLTLGSALAVALPVELSDFDAKALVKANQIEWTTQSERETKFFAIERSATGNSSWSEIGTVPAAGNSDVPLYYSFMDNAPLQRSFYRLRTVDLNGAVQYSHIVEVVRKKGVYGIINISPSPTIGTTTVKYEAEGEQNLSFQVVDITGKIVMEKTFITTKGLNLIELNLAPLEAGVYTVLPIGDSLESVPMMVVKQ